MHAFLPEHLLVLDKQRGDQIMRIHVPAALMSVDWSPSGDFFATMEKVDAARQQSISTLFDRLSVHGIEIYDIWVSVYSRSGEQLCRIEVVKDMKFAAGYIDWQSSYSN
jgi:hypothetical protein